MDKSRILEVFGVDDTTYQGTCTAIGLKNPATLTGVQLDHFEVVRGWLDKKECKNFKEATEAFKSWQAQTPTAAGLDELKSFVEFAADESMKRAAIQLKTLSEQDQAAIVQMYRQRQVEQAPKYRAMFEQLAEGQTVDADFLPSVPQPALPPS